jgi:hypothetical protein
MQSIYIISLLLIFYSISIRAEYRISDQIPLITIIYAQRNITIYTSASNPSREPKEWTFWHDPLIVFDSSKDIYQYNEQVRFQFSFSSAEFDQIARKTIISKMHPDVEKSALFWIIEPLPIDTFNGYIIDQTLLPISPTYPCIKSQLSGTLTFECQFQCSSMIIAHSITQNILCGKLKFQFEYYIQSIGNPITIPTPLATRFNFQSLRSNLGSGEYIHQRQENKLIEKYFIQIQSIDDTIKESDLQKLFGLAMNTTTRFELTQLNELWLAEDIESIINHDLFYIRFSTKSNVSFYLKSSDSPWALTSNDKQTFNTSEMQELLLSELQINADWSLEEKRWKIRSLTTHLLSDVLDNLQLVLITKQYNIDQINATVHRTIDCSDWSSICTCQSTSSAMVFISNTQFIRIPNIDIDFSLTGFTFEIWIRPDILSKGIQAVQILNFRDEYRLSYIPKGEVTFSLIDKTKLHLYTTTLQGIPLNQWTYLSCVYSSIEKQLQLYVNGEFVSSIILSTKSHQLSNDIIIGQDFLGAVRDFRLWSCVRSPDQIRFTMQMNKLIGNETCLVGLWPMVDGVGQTILDLTRNTTPHSGTLGFDDNPNLFNDPIWTYVLPTPPTPPPPRILTYQMFRENLTSPIVVQWGSIFDIAVLNSDLFSKEKKNVSI